MYNKKIAAIAAAATAAVTVVVVVAKFVIGRETKEMAAQADNCSRTAIPTASPKRACGTTPPERAASPPSSTSAVTGG